MVVSVPAFKETKVFTSTKTEAVLIQPGDWVNVTVYRVGTSGLTKGFETPVLLIL